MTYRHPVTYRLRLFVGRCRARLSLFLRPVRTTGGSTQSSDPGNRHVRMSEADAERLYAATRRY